MYKEKNCEQDVINVYSFRKKEFKIFHFTCTAVGILNKAALKVFFFTYNKQNGLMCSVSNKKVFPRDFEILGWCPAGPVLPHGEKVPLQPWLATLLVMVSR